MCVLSHFSPTLQFLWTVTHQAPLSMGFFRQNTGVGCHALFQGIFLTHRWNPHLLRLLHWQVGCSPLVPPQRRAETGLRSGEKRRQPAQGSCVISSRLFSPHQRIALLVGKRGIQPLEPPRLAHDSLQADAKWSLRRDSSACGRRPSNSGIQILKLPL